MLEVNMLGCRLVSEFKIFGRKIRVLINNEMEELGFANFEKGIIVLRTLGVSEEEIEATYHHEKFHMILYTLNYHKLNNDEQFVDLIARALHQIELTEIRKDVLPVYNLVREEGHSPSVLT